MDLWRLCGLIIFVGVCLWAANEYIPMQPMVKKILNGVVIVGLLIFLFSVFFGPIPSIRVGR